MQKIYGGMSNEKCMASIEAMSGCVAEHLMG